MPDFFKMDPRAQQAIVDQAQADLRDNTAGALPLVASGFDEAGTGDFIFVGAHPLLLNKVAVRVTTLQFLAIISHFTRGLATVMLAEANAMESAAQNPTSKKKS